MLKIKTFRSMLMAVACAIAIPMHAVADEPRKVEIPAGELTTALRQLAEATGVEFVYSANELRGVRTGGVSGEYTAEKAVKKLLEGTALKLTVHESGALLIAPPGLEEVLVQGKRYLDENADLPRTIDDPQPYYVFDSEQIEQSGTTSVEDFLKRKLTMNTSFISDSQRFELRGDYATHRGSVSSVNLRGLGENQTLILVNGRRVAGVSIANANGLEVSGAFVRNGQPDINGIPPAAIEKIVVLPSGGSAIYGGSATAGVINIILKRDYLGGDVRYTINSPVDVSAPIQTIDANYGFPLEGGRTRIMLTGQFSEGQSLLLEDRRDLIEGYVERRERNNPPGTIDSLFPPAGIGTTPSIASAGLFDNLVLADGTDLGASNTYIPIGTPPGSTDLDAGLIANAGSYNRQFGNSVGQYGLKQSFGVIPRNKSFRAAIRRDMASWLESFVDFSYGENASRSLDNPFDGVFAVAGRDGIPGFPPFIPDVPPNLSSPFRGTVLMTLPSHVTSVRETNSITRSFTVGLIATKLPADWTATMDYSWSDNKFSSTFFEVDPQFDADLLIGVDQQGNPLNPFVDTLQNPLPLERYLQRMDYEGSNSIDIVGLRGAGPVFNLPWGRPTLSAGVEHRKESSPGHVLPVIFPITDPDFRVVYFGQSRSADAIFGELNVPLFTEKNGFVGLRGLDLQIAHRSDFFKVTTGALYRNEFLDGTLIDYYPSAPGNPQQPIDPVRSEYTNTSDTLGLKYKPFNAITLRASYAKSFLPPEPYQLIPDPNPSLDPSPPIDDPVTGQNGYDGYTLFRGGNADLKPQNSESWNIGLIFEPQQGLLEGFRVNLEFYSIKQINVIINPSPQDIVNTPAYQDRITRDPNDPVTPNRIIALDQRLGNAYERKTRGWDLSLDYHRQTPLGIFELSARGTLIDYEKRQESELVPSLDYAGFPHYGGQAERKADFAITWSRGNWDAGWSTQWISSYAAYGHPDPPSAHSPDDLARQGGDTIPSQIYHDVFASYAFGNGGEPSGGGRSAHLLSDVTVQLGFKNVLNENPPYDIGFRPYLYSPFGDIRLRQIWLSARKAF